MSFFKSRTATTNYFLSEDMSLINDQTEEENAYPSGFNTSIRAIRRTNISPSKNIDIK